MKTNLKLLNVQGKPINYSRKEKELWRGTDETYIILTITISSQPET